MNTVQVTFESPRPSSFRALQVAGMFDLPPDRPIGHSLSADVPRLDDEWTIGAIVGPSGSGKSTLARAAFGGDAFLDPPCRPDRAVIDLLDDAARLSGRSRSIKELVRLLAGVGLGSVPTWLRPWNTLSTGEQFRASLALGLAGGSGALVCDEFTSALDRTIARTTAAAVGRLIRSRSLELPRLIAVTCHEDVLEWLAPDWVLRLGDDASARVTWPHWQRPHVELTVRRVPQALWQAFAGLHYLSGGLARSATCYGAFVQRDDTWASGFGERYRDVTATIGRGIEVVGFCAVVATLGCKRTKHITRLVVRPEFQGLGFGGRLLAAAATVETLKGNRVTITATHPAIVSHCRRSPRWRFLTVKKAGSTRQRFRGREIRSSTGRAVAAFEFAP